jgi:hypothetical protein
MTPLTPSIVLAYQQQIDLVFEVWQTIFETNLNFFSKSGDLEVLITPFSHHMTPMTPFIVLAYQQHMPLDQLVCKSILFSEFDRSSLKET